MAEGREKVEMPISVLASVRAGEKKKKMVKESMGHPDGVEYLKIWIHFVLLLKYEWILATQMLVDNQTNISNAFFV